jgi:hypothetical protein
MCTNKVIGNEALVLFLKVYHFWDFSRQLKGVPFLSFPTAYIFIKHSLVFFWNIERSPELSLQFFHSFDSLVDFFVEVVF